MTRTVFLLIATLLTGSVAADQPSVAEFAASRNLSHAQISPTGEYLSAIRTVKLDEFDKEVLVIFNYPEMTPSGTLALPDRTNVASYFWANSERVVARTTRDIENSEFDSTAPGRAAINADGSDPAMLLPRQYFGVVSRMINDPEHLLVGINIGSRGSKRADVEIGTLNIYTNRYRKKARAKMKDARILADANGQVHYSVAEDDDLNTVIHTFDEAERRWTLHSSTPLLKGAPSPVSVTSGGKSLYTQLAPEGGAYGLYHVDTETDKRTMLYQHEYADADALTDRAGVVWAARHESGVGETIVIDPDHPLGRIYNAVAPNFPDAEVSLRVSTDDYSKTVVRVGGGSMTTKWFLYEQGEAGNRLSLLFDSFPNIQDETLGVVEPFQLESRDGLTLHGYLTRPNTDAKNLPLVVMPHGGPMGIRDLWWYDPDVQVMASRGYAVLQVNFRGSGGYGPDFMEAGIGEYARGMQDDVADATRWAIASGFVDPERICIYGWSYGGFSALNGVVRYPELYRCAVGAAGVYDWALQARKADYVVSRRLRRMTERAIAKDRATLKEMSPVTYAATIEAPVFLIHGGKDRRVPIDHAHVMKQALERAGNPPEYMEKPLEGHGFASAENREEFYTRLLAFLDQHIGQK